jgi:hypothetical protein
MGRSDGGLRSIIHKHLKSVGDFQAIETGLIGGGVPDSNFCIQGKEGWIECKRTSGWTISNMEPSQVAWAERRVRNGGRVFCAVRRLNDGGPRTPKADELWLLPASAMRLLLLKARLNVLHPAQVLGHWVGGPENWDWLAVGKALQS